MAVTAFDPARIAEARVLATIIGGYLSLARYRDYPWALPDNTAQRGSPSSGTMLG